MRRYQFLQKDDIFSALNRLRDAFLAAKNGEEVEEIINGLLSYDEKMKIGRRIQIAECLQNDLTIDEVIRLLKVGNSTVVNVGKLLSAHPKCYELIHERTEAVKRTYAKNKFKKIGGSKLVIKRIITGKKYLGSLMQSTSQLH